MHLPPALATGNLDIMTDAMVREVTLDKRRQGRPAWSTSTRRRGKEHRAKARVVVLAASALRDGAHPAQFEARRSRTARQLAAARSASTSWTPSAQRLGGQIPLLENLPPHNEDGAGGDHVYVPWWLYKEQLAGKLGFARGYHIEFGGGRRMPGMGTGAGLEWLTGGSYGRKFKEDARRYYGSFVGFAGRGEMIPNEDSLLRDRSGR